MCCVGGLLVDLGVLSLRPGAIDASFFPDPHSGIPKLPPSHPAIIEWRAMTVIELYVRRFSRRGRSHPEAQRPDRGLDP